MSCRLLVAVLFTFAVAAPVRAHLIAEQRATLNFVESGAFLVISIPISALDGVDSDNDGNVSARELSTSLDVIRKQIVDGVLLYDQFGDALPLEGLMISLAPSHDDPAAPTDHLVAMGRFEITATNSVFALEILLLGDSADERTYDVSARLGDSRKKMVFNSSQTRHALVFPS